MAFQNRRADNLNRKKLIVENVDKDSNGNITSLLVRVVRADENVSAEGTALTAENLHNEIITMIRENTEVNEKGTSETKCICDRSNSIATTQFVWDVLTALGLTKINHNHVDFTGSDSGSGGSET